MTPPTPPAKATITPAELKTLLEPPAKAAPTITPAELKTLLEWMGLPKTWFAAFVGLKDVRQVAKWEDGHAPIPDYAATALVKLWNEAARAVQDMVAAATIDTSGGGVITLHTYRVDKDCFPSEFPASYYRALTARTMDHLLMRTRYRVEIQFTTKEKP